MSAAVSPEDVLQFWFGVPGDADWGASRDWWFRKHAATDRKIADRFAVAVDAALAGAFAGWTATPGGALALILLLDQMPRNIHRDTPRAFAGDARACDVARQLVASGGYDGLLPVQQWFAALPFEHSESLADQRESVRLFAALAERGFPEPLPWAHKHYEVIERFGRFPHRNAILGRASTAAELAYLARHGGF